MPVAIKNGTDRMAIIKVIGPPLGVAHAQDTVALAPTLIPRLKGKMLACCRLCTGLKRLAGWGARRATVPQHAEERPTGRLETCVGCNFTCALQAA